MAEKCEFVLEPKAVEFTGLIQSMTGKHQLWELWADFIALTAISCSHHKDRIKIFGGAGAYAKGF